MKYRAQFQQENSVTKYKVKESKINRINIVCRTF